MMLAFRSPLVGESPAIQGIFSTIEKVSQTDSTVLIIGESGTGKELVARAIHENSPRASKPLVIVNCGAIPAELLDAFPADGCEYYVEVGDPKGYCLESIPGDEVDLAVIGDALQGHVASEELVANMRACLRETGIISCPATAPSPSP